MIDINLIRENRDLVKENIKKKFQDEKLPLVDEVYEKDIKYREIKTKADELRAERNKVSDNIGMFVRNKEMDKVEEAKKRVNEINTEIANLEVEEERLAKQIKDIMFTIPNIVASDVPVGKDDSENVEEKVFGDPKKVDYEIPYHADIMASFNGLDKDAAGRVTGNGFYYLMGDIARLHSAVLAYARDFMIDKGFTYCIPPYMIRSEAVDGGMSFTEK